MRDAPEKYLNVTVPESIAKGWRAWDGVEWRRNQHAAHGNFYPPDQRFGVDITDGMCALHRRNWITWRNKHFQGIRFPGLGCGDGWVNARTEADLPEMWERARAEWDEQTIAQMRQGESICLSGRSRQCEGERRRADCSPMAPDSARHQNQCSADLIEGVTP